MSKKPVTAKNIVSEVLNSASYGFGIIGISWITVLFVINSTSTLETVSYLLFGICVGLVFLFSYLYHALCFTSAKTVFQRMDVASIHLAIIGIYLPFCLIHLHGIVG